MPTSDSRGIFRFHDFELDVASYELRRYGRAVKLGRQPMDLLMLLVEQRRRLVSRDEIVEHLWGKDVFVDVDTGVNTAISKIRQALRDSPEAPVFVETVPGKGYRFIAPVDVVTGVPDPMPAVLSEALAPPPAAGPATDHATAPRADRASSHRWARLALGVAIVAMVVGAGAWTWLGGGASVTRVTLAVLPVENLGRDPEREYLAAGLTEETSVSLAQIDPDRLSVKGRTLHYKGTTKTAVEIGQELSVDYLVQSSIRAEGRRLRVTATLIRVRDQEHVWSQSYEREPTSLLGLQQELSTAIAEQIRVRLSPDQARGAARRQTRNADAYDTYLRARYFENRKTPATNVLAIQEYRRAIALDPGYALAWSSMAATYGASVLNGDARPLDVGRWRETPRCRPLARIPILRRRSTPSRI